jgi:type III secretory pathway lipoprotein EscJ
MVTLRTYPDLIDASMAKSELEANGIACTLADENANQNTAAKFDIPVRLLVAEDQIAEALKILDPPSGAAGE